MVNLKVNQVLKTEMVVLESRGSKQALSDLRNLKAFARVCENYGLNEINVNASNVNVGIVAIELMKKILSKTYKSNIYNHNDENIYRVNGKMCQFGSYVISKPALTRENAKAFEKVLVLVHSNTTKGIYAIDKTTAINLNKRLSISDIVNNGKKVLDF